MVEASHFKLFSSFSWRQALCEHLRRLAESRPSSGVETVSVESGWSYEARDLACRVLAQDLGLGARDGLMVPPRVPRLDSSPLRSSEDRARRGVAKPIAGPGRGARAGQAGAVRWQRGGDGERGQRLVL